MVNMYISFSHFVTAMASLVAFNASFLNTHFR